MTIMLLYLHVNFTIHQIGPVPTDRDTNAYRVEIRPHQGVVYNESVVVSGGEGEYELHLQAL